MSFLSASLNRTLPTDQMMPQRIPRRFTPQGNMDMHFGKINLK